MAIKGCARRRFARSPCARLREDSVGLRNELAKPIRGGPGSITTFRIAQPDCVQCHYRHMKWSRVRPLEENMRARSKQRRRATAQPRVNRIRRSLEISRANRLKPIRRRMYDPVCAKWSPADFSTNRWRGTTPWTPGAALGAMGSPSKCQRSEWDRMALCVHCGAQRCGIPNSKPNSRNT